eukprot:4780860-Prymnesium_polylepis.2
MIPAGIDSDTGLTPFSISRSPLEKESTFDRPKSSAIMIARPATISQSSIEPAPSPMVAERPVRREGAELRPVPRFAGDSSRPAAARVKAGRAQLKGPSNFAKPPVGRQHRAKPDRLRLGGPVDTQVVSNVAQLVKIDEAVLVLVQLGDEGGELGLGGDVQPQPLDQHEQLSHRQVAVVVQVALLEDAHPQVVRSVARAGLLHGVLHANDKRLGLDGDGGLAVCAAHGSQLFADLRFEVCFLSLRDLGDRRQHREVHSRRRRTGSRTEGARPHGQQAARQLR